MLVDAASALCTVGQHRMVNTCYMKLNTIFKHMSATTCFIIIKHCVCFFMEITFLDYRQNSIEKYYADFMISSKGLII